MRWAKGVLMSNEIPDARRLAILAALANGIIPPDDRDAGVAAVDAGGRLLARIQSGINSGMYLKGIETAQSLAAELSGCDVSELNAEELHALIGRLRDCEPAFFKQLRMDVAAIYLSDPGVWQRIGFPGPSIQTGGYPDFDQPQEWRTRRKN